MPLYAFVCDCGVQQEWFGPTEERPEHLPCTCGQQAARDWTIAKDRACAVGYTKALTDQGAGAAKEARFNRALNSALLGRAVKRTQKFGPKIKQRDAEMVQRAKSQERQNRSAGSKGSQAIKRVAELPKRWVAEKLMLHGNEYFQRPAKDIKSDLKDEGLLLNN